MASNFNKRSLYKPAVLSEKSPDIVTPRRNQPVPSPVLHTPPPLSKSLSLSDGEGSLVLMDETNEDTLTKLTNTSNTIISMRTIDHSKDTVTSNSQVPVSVIKLPSPVRVIRHSPPPPPPFDMSRRFSTNFVSLPPPPPSSTSTCISPPLLSPTKIPHDKNDEREYEKREGEMSLKQHLVTGEEDFSDDCNSVTIDEVRKFVNKDSDSENTEIPSSQSDLSVCDSKKRKKKAIRTVSSRYMEPVNKKTSLHLSSTSFIQQPGTSKQNKLNQSYFNASKNLSFHPSHGFTSTPAVKGPHPPINKHDTSLFGGGVGGAKVGGVSKGKKSSGHNNQMTTGAIKKTGGAPLDPCSNQYLQYVRLLQMTYLNIKAHKAKKEQEEMAYSQLYTLWEACQQRRSEVWELRKEIEYKNRTRAMDSSIRSQLDGLEQLCDKLPSVKTHHTSLATALDTTLHQLPIKNIITSNNNTDQDVLSEAFTEAEIATGHIVSSIDDITPQIVSLSNNVESLAEMVKKEQELLQKVQSQLVSVTKDQVHETSLYFEKLLNQHCTAPSLN